MSSESSSAIPSQTHTYITCTPGGGDASNPCTKCSHHLQPIQISMHYNTPIYMTAPPTQVPASNNNNNVPTEAQEQACADPGSTGDSGNQPTTPQSSQTQAASSTPNQPAAPTPNQPVAVAQQVSPTQQVHRVEVLVQPVNVAPMATIAPRTATPNTVTASSGAVARPAAPAGGLSTAAPPGAVSSAVSAGGGASTAAGTPSAAVPVGVVQPAAGGQSGAVAATEGAAAPQAGDGAAVPGTSADGQDR